MRSAQPATRFVPEIARSVPSLDVAILARVPRVTDWPSYLFKRVPPELRARLSTEAIAADSSINDVIREHLCRRFKLRCPPRSTGYLPQRDSGSEKLLLRLDPKLFKKVCEQAQFADCSIRDVILETLEGDY